MSKKFRQKDFRQLMARGEKISENIVFCADGKYRWTYAMSLYKDPSIFLLVWKICFFVTLGIFAFMIILDVINWGWKTENIVGILKFFLYFVIGMTVLVGLGYLLYALIMGGGTVSEGSALFCAPKHFEFQDPQLKVWRQGDYLLVEAAAFAKHVCIESDDADMLLSDNFFDLQPGIRRLKILRGHAENLRVRSVWSMDK